MHSLKQIILVSVAAALFLAAGYIVYTNFYSDAATNVATEVGALGRVKQGRATIFPYGERLDLSIVRKYNRDGNRFPYPLVIPELDVGVPVNDLIRGQPDEQVQ
jgi:hypothetical protein